MSLAYSFNDGAAPGRLHTQYFEIMGSRAIYHDGWMASAFGPREPWSPGVPAGIREWTPDKDKWELYNLDADWSQAKDLADEMPEKLGQMKELFAMEAARNKVYRVGGGLWVVLLHPELRAASPNTSWRFAGDMVRMPEFPAPALGNKPNLVTLDVDIPDNASGVLYALGAFAAGLTCYVDDGVLCYEYNLFLLQRTKIRSTEKLPTGRVKIAVETVYQEARRGGPLTVTLRVNGAQIAQGLVPVSAPMLFSANDCLDVGQCLGSPVSDDYYDRAPFPFTGKLHRMEVQYLPVAPPVATGS